MITPTMVGLLVLALGGGVALGYVIRQTIAKNRTKDAEGHAERIIADAKTKAQEALLEAKNKAVDIIDQANQEEKERKMIIHETEKRLEKREDVLETKMEEVEEGKKALEAKAQEVRDVRARVEEMRKEEMKRLESIGELTQEQAKKALLQLTEAQNKEELAQQMMRLQKQSHEDLEREARNIMTHVIQKYSRSHAAEVMTSTLTIP